MICISCNVDKDLSEFYTSGRNKSGYEYTCKRCKNRQCTERHKNYKNFPRKKILSKICPQCRLEKNIENFNKNSSSKDGYNCWCQNCTLEKSKQNSKRVSGLIKDTDSVISRVCPKCNKERDIKLFTKNNFHLDGFNSWCNLCYRNKRYEDKYGKTMDQKNRMIIEQGQKCLSCNKKLDLTNPKMVCIDHDHCTGRVRGILCNNCNRSLGILKENPDKIYKLYLYALKYC